MAGGKAAFLGAAGPMGQMHVQRALQAQHGPGLIVATDLVPERLDVIKVKYRQLIEAKRGRPSLCCAPPAQLSPPSFNASLVEMTGGHGL